MPDWSAEIRRRLTTLRLVPAREAAIVEELAQDLEDCYAELLANGASEAEACQQTLAELSGSELLTRELRRVERQIEQEPIILGMSRRSHMIADFWQDLRYGVRMLRKNPGFTLIAVITLALGIGANTAIFSVVNAVLLKPLPYPDAEQLVRFYDVFPAKNQERVGPSVPEWADYRLASSFEAVGAYDTGNLNLSADGGNAAERLESVAVTPEILSLLKIAPYKGRLFLPEEGQPGNDNIVIISYALWQRRFGADEALVGNRKSPSALRSGRSGRASCGSC